MPSITTNAHVNQISQIDGKFLLNISDARQITADRVFCGTGRSAPIIPNIKGLNRETCTLYEDFNPETAASVYKNKTVVILGRGNSAFEIAHHLVDITAETRVVTRSLPKFARQTHNVHDIRGQVSDVFDLMQLKSNNNIVSDRIVEVSRITSGKDCGRLLIRYDTPCAHWTPPRRMRRTGIVDDIIVCCGFDYTMSDIFDTTTINPDCDEQGKYCLLTSTWESVNVPNLYFIGAPTRVNDPDAASGFVHGFRCNIQALGHLISEKYHEMPVKPLFECKIDLNSPSGALELLSQFLVEMVSTTMPLFELYGYFGSMITFEQENGENTISACVWPPFPRQYNRERWADTEKYVEIVFEYGFSRYGKGDLPTHYFTLPANHFDTSRSAYIHPVFHVFHEGNEVDQFHMQESLIGRWDIDDYVDKETNLDQYKNVAFNACSSALGWSERRSMLPVLEEYIDECYPLMTEEEVAEALRIQPTLALLSN